MKKSNKVFTEQEKQELKNNYETISLRELARRNKTTTDNVKAILTEMGVALRGRGRPASSTVTKNKRSGQVTLLDDSNEYESSDLAQMYGWNND